MTAFVIQNAPNRFVSRTSRQASTLIRMIRSSRVMPGVVDEDVDLAEGLEGGLDDRLRGLRLARRRPGWRRPAAEPLDDRDRLGRRRLVAPVGERDVRALGREPGHDRPPDAARAAGDERRLAGQVDHACTFPCARSGSPGTTSSSGTSTGPGWRHDLGERVGDRVDRVPVDRQPDVDVLGLDGGVTGDPARRVGRPLDGDRAAT